MKFECDARMRSRECSIVVGSHVLIKLERVNKTTPPWNPNPFVVTNIKGSIITAARYDRVTTRNSSFFKLYHMEEDEEATVQLALTVHLTSPSLHYAMSNTIQDKREADLDPIINVNPMIDFQLPEAEENHYEPNQETNN